LSARGEKVEKANWKETKNLPQKLKFTYKEQKDWEHIEDEIAELEGNLSQLDKAMEDASSSYSRLQELMEEKEKTERILEEKMERWMYLSNLAEQIAAQK
ncbi:MAG: ABC transporter C-terminal domain-containing protein, partial [Lachnospiraceae bacterium]|nr:ABC transporter C-terminal domain-containing protein [Lachnospiraceae bacterium]